MSGFLHRIAAQAIGSPKNTLHSLARLPYAILPSPVHNEEYDGQVATLGTIGNKQHLIASNSVVEFDQMPNQNQPRESFHAEISTQAVGKEVIPPSPETLIAQSTTNQPRDSFHAEIGTQAVEKEVIPLSPETLITQPITNQLRDSFHGEISTQAVGKEVIPPSPETLIAQSATGFITKPDLEITHPSSVKSKLRQPETSIKKTDKDKSFVLDEVIKTYDPLNDSATESIANNESYSNLTETAIPPPLLPLKNTVNRSVLNSSTVAQRGEPKISTWQSQVEETTEVHVSIGRIEVTAVHETPPPKRQTPAATKPMTLDEYLARRRRQI